MLRLWNILSLDVCAGALAGGMLAAKMLNASMPWHWYLLLPLGVWVIYTTDHLLDAMRLKAESHTERHSFHFHHRNLLIPVLMIAVSVCAVIALLYLDEKWIKAGLLLLGLSAVHFSLVRLVGASVSPLLVKEAGVAFVYTAGVLTFPFLQSGQSLACGHVAAFAELFGIALLNLLVYSLYEKKSDLMDGHSSFVLGIGEKASGMFFLITAMAVLGIAIYYFAITSLHDGWRLQLPWLLVGGMQVLLFSFPGYFTTNLRYRLAGDGIFLVQLPFALM